MCNPVIEHPLAPHFEPQIVAEKEETVRECPEDDERLWKSLTVRTLMIHSVCYQLICYSKSMICGHLTA